MAYTYTDLRQKIIDNTENDYATFASNIDDFIRKTELDVFRDCDLRAWRKHASTTINTHDGFITLPVTTPDVIIRDLFLVKADGSYAFLQPRNYSWLRDYWPNKIRTAQPQFYSHWSTDIIAIAPPPDIDYLVEIEYSALPTSIVDGGDFGSSITLSITTPGANYAVDDVLTLIGGSGPAAKVTVTGVSGTGGIISFTLTFAGAYLLIPQSPVAALGGNGFGATFTIGSILSIPTFSTWLSANGWDALLAGSMIYALAFEKAEAQAVGETQQGTPGLWDQLYTRAIQRLNLTESRERLDDFKSRAPQ